MKTVVTDIHSHVYVRLSLLSLVSVLYMFLHTSPVSSILMRSALSTTNICRQESEGNVCVVDESAIISCPPVHLFLQNSVSSRAELSSDLYIHTWKVAHICIMLEDMHTTHLPPLEHTCTPSS